MQELDIEIEGLKTKRATIQESMRTPFRYGRSPDGAEYLEIAEMGRELEKVEYALCTLEELRDTVLHNRKFED